MGNTCCKSERIDIDETGKRPVGQFVTGNLDDFDSGKTIATYSDNPHSPADGPLSQKAPEVMSKIEEAMKKIKYSEDESLTDLSKKIKGLLEYKTLPTLGPYRDTIQKNVYYGNYKDGKKNGVGSLLWETDEKVYYGEFKDNIMNGEGILISKNGVYYYGEWKNGKSHGHGVSYGDDDEYINLPTDSPLLKSCKRKKILYEGEWSDGQKHGKGYITSTEDMDYIYEGVWINGVLSENNGLQLNLGTSADEEYDFDHKALLYTPDMSECTPQPQNFVSQIMRVRSSRQTPSNKKIISHRGSPKKNEGRPKLDSIASANLSDV